jgi:hypothetical protein
VPGASQEEILGHPLSKEACIRKKLHESKSVTTVDFSRLAITFGRRGHRGAAPIFVGNFSVGVFSLMAPSKWR